MSLSLETIWLTVGFAGQIAFGMRFLAQWLSSERAGRSVVPIGFWYLSIVGGALLLAYAVYRRDPVFIAGQVTGVLIYGRNLQLIYRSKRKSEPEGDSATSLHG